MHRTGITTEVSVARLALDQFFDTKHDGCVLMAKARSLGREGTKTSRWDRVVERKVEIKPPFEPK